MRVLKLVTTAAAKRILAKDIAEGITTLPVEVEIIKRLSNEPAGSSGSEACRSVQPLLKQNRLAELSTNDSCLAQMHHDVIAEHSEDRAESREESGKPADRWLVQIGFVQL